MYAKQLRTQPALADARLADERHELDGRVAGAPVEQALQERPLDLATDERAFLRPDQIRAEPRPRRDRRYSRTGSRLPLPPTGASGS